MFAEALAWTADPVNSGWVNLATLAGLALGLLGLTISLVGLWLVWRQARNARTAAQAAKDTSERAVASFDEQTRRLAVQAIAWSFGKAEDDFAQKRFDRAHREIEHALSLIDEAVAVAPNTNGTALHELREYGYHILSFARRLRDSLSEDDPSKVDRAFAEIRKIASQLSASLRKAES